ncbi:MAG: formylglycine-generating enzyme family protein [Candidatus Brocadiia bacterium]
MKRRLHVAAFFALIAVLSIGGYWFLHSPPKAPDVKCSVGIALVPVAPGSFSMGSNNGFNDEKPVHKVVISHPFLIGATEVTQKQYTAVTGEIPGSFKGDELPVECVTWNRASEFCKLLTELERRGGTLPDGYEYRLPTEAEWEYCCRAGTTTEFYSGDSATVHEDYCWSKKTPTSRLILLASGSLTRGGCMT